MIGPVSGTGRAMMSSLQQAMSKGMPADQAIAYVKSMAMDGIAPLTDLYSMMMQFQRLKEPTRRPPEGGNIRQQLNMIENMQDPMQQGLGGMNAGTMEEPSFAGGGIVAFQQGGPMPGAPAPAGIPGALDYTDPQAVLRDLTSRTGANMPAGQFVDQQMQIEDEIAKKYGLGQYGQLYKARQQQIEQMQRELPTREAEERQIDRAEFFFNLAAAAADPGATFATSLGKAGSGYTKAKRATNERLRELQKEAQDAGLKMLEAEELRRQGDVDNAMKLHTEGKNKAIEVGMEIWREQNRREDAKAMRAVMLEQVKLKGEAATRADIVARMAKLDRNSDEYKELKGILDDITPGVASAQARSMGKTPEEVKSEINGIDDAIEKLRTDRIQFPANSTKRKEYDDAIADLQMQRRALVSQGAGTGDSSAGGVLRYNPATGRIE